MQPHREPPESNFSMREAAPAALVEVSKQIHDILNKEGCFDRLNALRYELSIHMTGGNLPSNNVRTAISKIANASTVFPSYRGAQETYDDFNNAILPLAVMISNLDLGAQSRKELRKQGLIIPEELMAISEGFNKTPKDMAKARELIKNVAELKKSDKRLTGVHIEIAELIVKFCEIAEKEHGYKPAVHGIGRRRF